MKRILRHYLDKWSLRPIASPFFSQEGFLIFVEKSDHRPCVLKVFHEKKFCSDDCPGLAFLKHHQGTISPTLYKYNEQAILMERVLPGLSLKKITQQGHDDRAANTVAEILVDIQKRSPKTLPSFLPGTSDFLQDFQKVLSQPSEIIPLPFLVEGMKAFERLYHSQAFPVLLHGDLHHDNVLQGDKKKSWVIDPKGLVGEIAYDTGAFLRNPIDELPRVTNPDILEKRLNIFSAGLNVAPHRLLVHGYTQALLASIRAEQDQHIDLAKRFYKVATFLRSALETDQSCGI